MCVYLLDVSVAAFTSMCICLAPPTTPPPTTTPVPTDAPTNAPFGTTNTHPDSLPPLSTMAMPSEGGGASNPADPNSLSTTGTLGCDMRQSQGGGISGGVTAAIVIIVLVLLASMGVNTYFIVFWM